MFHQSDARPWPRLLSTSGARYSGVPHSEYAPASGSVIPSFARPTHAHAPSVRQMNKRARAHAKCTTPANARSQPCVLPRALRKAQRNTNTRLRARAHARTHSRTEVGKFDVPVFVKQYVLRFEITVHYTQTVQVLQRCGNLRRARMRTFRTSEQETFRTVTLVHQPVWICNRYGVVCAESRVVS